VGAQARWIATADHPWGLTQAEFDEMLRMVMDGWPSFEYNTGPGAGLGKDADPAYIESIARYMRAAASPSAVYAYEQMNGAIDTRNPCHRATSALASCRARSRAAFWSRGR
jgi:hypothetical protein